MTRGIQNSCGRGIRKPLTLLFPRFFQEGLTDASSNAKTEKNHAWDDGVTEEFVDSIALMVRKGE